MPLAPIMRMYIHEIVVISALPLAAADTEPLPSPLPSTAAASAPDANGSEGRYGARCAATAIGPMPGPPPPCGMQNVLCRFMWQTSAPMWPGPVSPAWAFRFAPSM